MLSKIKTLLICRMVNLISMNGVVINTIAPIKDKPAKTCADSKIVNKVSQRSLRTNEISIRYGEDLYVSDVTAICLSL